MTETSLPEVVTAGPDMWVDPITVPERTQDQIDADEFAASLGAVGAFLRANPHLMSHMRHGYGSIALYLHTNKARDIISEFIAAAQTHGVEMAEHRFNDYGGVDLKFGAVDLRVRAYIPYLIGEQPKPPRPAYRPFLDAS